MHHHAKQEKSRRRLGSAARWLAATAALAAAACGSNAQGKPEDDPLAGHSRADATAPWQSGFENGWPGEFFPYVDGAFSSDGSQKPDRSSAWTIVNRASGEPVFSGDHAYKGRIYRAKEGPKPHRAYPVLHTDIPTPLVNSWMVWLDVDWSRTHEWDWIHLGTWGNNEDWKVHTLSVFGDQYMMMDHLDWNYARPEIPKFPLRQWVRMTVYLHYPPDGDGTVAAWQDGLLVAKGTFTRRMGSNLRRAHWGLYGKYRLDDVVQYNDDIRIWQLDAPLGDLEQEPRPPIGVFPAVAKANAPAP